MPGYPRYVEPDKDFRFQEWSHMTPNVCTETRCHFKQLKLKQLHVKYVLGTEMKRFHFYLVWVDVERNIKVRKSYSRIRSLCKTFSVFQEQRAKDPAVGWLHR